MSHWNHFSSQNSKEVEKFVNQQKPQKDGLVGMLSHGKDFHVWVKEGDNFQSKWVLKHNGAWQGDHTATEFATMLNGGKIVPVGFNMSSPPNIWYFEQE